MVRQSRAPIHMIFAAAFLVAGIADAQFNQYTLPGGPQDRPEDRETKLKRELAAARYHFGPVKVAPQIGIKDVAYVRNLFASARSEASDVTATLGAGAHAYLLTGTKMTWVAHVLPDYIAWRRRTDARRLNLTYGIESLGFFNRLFVGVAVGRTEQLQILTPEIPEPVNGRSDQAQVTTELRVSGALYAFATASESRQKGLVDDLVDPLLRQIALLDRTEEVVRAGLRWRQRAGWTIGVGGEHSQVDFDSSMRDSSNSGNAPVLELRYDAPRFFFQSDLADRSLEARQGSRFVPFHGVTGNAAVAFQPRPGLEIWTYGSRNLVYSLSPTDPYIDDRRVGLALSMGAGRRVSSRLFAEAGEERYVAFSPAFLQRLDNMTAFGGSAHFKPAGIVTLGFQVMRTRFTSNLPGGGRSYTTGGFSVTLGSP